MLAGYVVTLHASQWYAASGLITEQPVLDDLIAGLEAALPLLRDTSCPHTAAEHPKPSGDPSGDAMTGYFLRSPGGRAELRAWSTDELLKGWLCHGFLRGLAEEALSNLRYTRGSLVGPRDDRLLDGTYTRPDGRLDIGALTHCFDEAEYDRSWEAENAVRWAARRYAATGDDSPRERLVLLLPGPVVRGGRRTGPGRRRGDPGGARRRRKRRARRGVCARRGPSAPLPGLPGAPQPPLRTG